jgi:hypothetical protein
MKEGKRICDKCGGEGTLPPEPLMVDCPSLDILLSKQATPDPSADCLPPIQEVKYLIGSIKQALQAFPGDSMFTETSVGLRYGTIRDLLAIMLNDAEEMGRSWEAKKETK